jgi:type II secretory pathway pseudopilin PulG
MFVPTWALRIAPYVGGVLLAVAAYAWAYSNGKQAERAKWQAREAAAVAAAQAKSAAMQAQVDAAGAVLSEQAAAIDRLTHVQKLNTRTFYVQNPSNNVACLDDGVLRAIAESDNVPHDTSAASASPR